MSSTVAAPADGPPPWQLQAWQASLLSALFALIALGCLIGLPDGTATTVPLGTGVLMDTRRGRRTAEDKEVTTKHVEKAAGSKTAIKGSQERGQSRRPRDSENAHSSGDTAGHSPEDAKSHKSRTSVRDTSGDDDSVVRISARADRHNDQLKRTSDELDGSIGKDGKAVHAIGDEDNKLICEHYPESQLQPTLLLKLLRCTCTWGFDDYGGVLLVCASSFLIVVLARTAGDHRLYDLRLKSSWVNCSVASFVVVNAFMAGVFRSNCFTWADVSLFYCIFNGCCIPWCYCTAFCFAEPPPVDSEGREIPLEISEEEGLICVSVLKTSHEDGFGESVHGISSRELVHEEIQRHQSSQSHYSH